MYNSIENFFNLTETKIAVLFMIGWLAGYVFTLTKPILLLFIYITSWVFAYMIRKEINALRNPWKKR